MRRIIPLLALSLLTPSVNLFGQNNSGASLPVDDASSGYNQTQRIQNIVKASLPSSTTPSVLSPGARVCLKQSDQISNNHLAGISSRTSNSGIKFRIPGLSTYPNSPDKVLPLSTCPNILVDGSFESGPGGTAWTQSSTNFGTPICDPSTCGTGTGTGPRTGNYWAWFGGYAGGSETGTIAQTVVFPSGDSISLSFYIEQILCDSPQDFLNVTVDGNNVYSVNGSSTLCGLLGYTNQTVDLSAYADGNPHTITFTSTTFSINGGQSNFFIDDIALYSCPPGPPTPACDDTLSFSGINLSIPDSNASGVTNSQTVTGVPGTALGQDVQLRKVCFKINHTWVGDLIVKLIAPNGTIITLLDRPGFPSSPSGCSGENLDMCIIQGTGNEAENICNTLPAITGDFTAFNGTDLDAINAAGGSPNGSWQLFVSDNATGDTGTLVNWQLIFNTGPDASWAAPAEVCHTSLPVNLNSLVTGTNGGTWSGTGVSGNNFSPAGLSGAIPVTYTVTNGQGCSDSSTQFINVVTSVPSASFTTIPVSLTVYFNNTTSGATSYQWNFGDGNSSSIENPNHTYTIPLSYLVSLTATNACGSNSSSQQIVVQNCPDSLLDGGLENGPSGGAWTAYSLNFGNPICNITSCGMGSGSGPRSGAYWAWFGGAAFFEESYISQLITLPSNSTPSLTFWLEQVACDTQDDFLKVSVDSDTLFITKGNSAICGQQGYSLQSVSLAAYADGLPHNLKFFSRVYGTGGGVTEFFVDDIRVNACAPIGIDENPLLQKVTIAPVPARDQITIRLTNIDQQSVSIEIKDIIGRNVINKTIALSNGIHSETLDVSSWNQGVYMLKVIADGSELKRKIVVQ